MAMSDQDVPVDKHGVVRIPVVHPWALEPYVAIGQAPPAAHETPWQVLCAHGLSCKLTRGSSGARSFFCPVAIGHLHFTPTMVFGERRLLWPRCRCRRPSHITLIARPSACMSCARGWRMPLPTGWADGLFTCISAQFFFLLPVCGPFWVPSKAPFGCKRHVKGTWRYSHFPDAMASPRCS